MHLSDSKIKYLLSLFLKASLNKAKDALTNDISPHLVSTLFFIQYFSNPL